MLVHFFRRLRSVLTGWWRDIRYLFRGRYGPIRLPDGRKVQIASQGAPRSYQASTRIDERLEYVREMRFSVAPGCDETQTTSHEFKWILLQVHGAVLRGPADRQALADVRLKVEVGQSTNPLLDLPLNLITEGEHTLERRIQALEAALRHLQDGLDRYTQASPDPAVQAMRRLGWTRGNADYRVLSVPAYAEPGTKVRCRVSANEGVDFEPFEWQLTLRGMDTRPVA